MNKNMIFLLFFDEYKKRLDKEVIRVEKGYNLISI